jgi:replicative DNA helicase
MSTADRTNGHGRTLEGPVVPPQNLEAEQSVLGAVLLSDTALPALIIDERLQPEDFYRESHGLIFKAMLDLHTLGEPVDVLTLVEHLKQAGQLDSVGGRAAVDLLAGSVPAVGNLRQYARIVRDNAMLRRLLRAAYEIQSRVHSHEAPPRELVDLAERAILEVAQQDSRKDFRAIDALLMSELDKLQTLSRDGKAITGTPSGFEDLDTITGGFQPGNLIILAARPSMGKCLAGGAMVYDPARGERRRIDELVAEAEQGEQIHVVSLGPDMRLRVSRVSAAQRSGVQPVYRLTTRRGRQLVATANHPLLTLGGWVELGALRLGARIAVPRRLPREGSNARFEIASGRFARASEGGAVVLARPTIPAVADLFWDAVAAVEYAGEEETYDLEVAGDRNFVADDVVVHNSALMANFAENAALDSKKAVALFSLEMSESELAQRFIASQAGIKGDDLRKGRVPDSRWSKILGASNRLASSPLYIDDSSDLSVLDVRAKTRRLSQQHADGLGLILIDYLQLMRHQGGIENRVEQIGQISRGLKTLARELDVPVIALSQLNRGVEQRTDKRPVLSDLRESGCLAGESRVYLPDAGEYRRIDELVGLRDFRVTAVNTESWKLESCRVANAFSTGRKPVFAMRTRLGRRLRATANHRFLTIDGWRRLDELAPGSMIAMPRELPGPLTPSMSDDELALLGHLIGDGCTLPRHAIQYTTREPELAQIVTDLAKRVFGDAVRPRIKAERTWHQVYLASAQHLTHGQRNPVAAWLDELGTFGLRSHEKRVPDAVFRQPVEGIATFLRHLWATDGCLSPGKQPRIYYATSSETLADDVQSLLLRIGISATRYEIAQRNSPRPQFHVHVTGAPDQRRFATEVWAVGDRRERQLLRLADRLGVTAPVTNRDVIPREVWSSLVEPAREAAGITTREMQAALGMRYCGSTLYKRNAGRERAARVAEIVGSDTLARLAVSDVYWDRIEAIDPDGEAEVYDLTVDRLHNFVANGVITHNSIEQDADLVMFIYRDEYYDKESEREGLADVIIAKHRNGGLGTVELSFQKEFPRFLSYVGDDRY